MLSKLRRPDVSSPLRAAARSFIRRINLTGKYSFTVLDELTCLANQYGSDKGSLWPSAHYYTRIYRHLFAPLRDKEIVFLEIGLMRTDDDKRRATPGHEGASDAKAATAPSLRMWREYFPNAHLYGFDVDDFSRVEIPNCRILQGDMSSPDDLDRLIEAIGRPIDIIIDDASHVSHHQQIAFGKLFPAVVPGGMYIIEDLAWQDPHFERADAVKTRELLRELAVTGRFLSPYISVMQRQFIEASVHSVQLFDSLTPEIQFGYDALATVIKR